MKTLTLIAALFRRSLHRTTLAAVAVTALAALAALGIGVTAQAGILISHTFDGANGAVINGDSLDVNNVGASNWVSGASAGPTDSAWVEEDGSMFSANAVSAWVGLNGAITTGDPDDLYELAIVIDHLNEGDVMGGFWGPQNPSVTGSHDFQMGIAWWLWNNGSSNNLTAYGGPDRVDQISGTASLSTGGGDQLLTIALDLTDATLSNNSFSLYIGDSTTGTLVGTGNFSGDEAFDEVGISGRFVSPGFVPPATEGAIVTSLTLSQINQFVTPEPSTFALAALALLSLGFIGWRRRRR